MTNKSEILDQIIFYILKRAQCEEDTDKYLEYVLDYCKKDYKQAYEKQNGIELTMAELIQKYANHIKK
tara:strand:- start:584 stop:787 length:204 start_codon:yes stop_codon:yes gene_type:complete